MSIKDDINSAMGALQMIAPDSRTKMALGQLAKALEKLAKKVEALDKDDPDDRWGPPRRR